MNILHAIVIGLVEGATEFIPVSSTAHILIVEKVLGITTSQTFEIAVQMGAMLAVLGLYLSEVQRVVRDIPKLFVAFIPTLLTGLYIYPYLDGLYENFWIIGFALVVGGLIMITIPVQELSGVDSDDRYSLTWSQSLWVGFAQMFAIIPGISRSGGIFIIGEIKNIPRRALVRFSFLLGAGTILSASIYSIVKSQDSWNTIQSAPFLVAFVVAGISAWYTCRWLLVYMENAPLKYFGWYRVLLGLILILFLV